MRPCRDGAWVRDRVEPLGTGGDPVSDAGRRYALVAGTTEAPAPLGSTDRAPGPVLRRAAGPGRGGPPTGADPIRGLCPGRPLFRRPIGADGDPGQSAPGDRALRGDEGPGGSGPALR